MRVTTMSLMTRIKDNLGRALSRMGELQIRISQGKQLTRPSDDPFLTAKSLGLRSTLSSFETYSENIEDLMNSLSVTDSIISQAQDSLERARELALRAANQTLSQNERNAVVVELDHMMEETVRVGNTIVGGTYVFAGHLTDRAPFEAARDPATGAITAVVYRGDSGVNKVEIGPQAYVSAGMPGNRVFSGPLDVFEVLIQQRDHTAAGDVAAISGDVGRVDRALDQLLSCRATLGARLSRMKVIRDRISNDEISYKQLLSTCEDLDVAEAAVALATHQTVYSAALAAAARAIPPTLVDFLR